LPSRAYGRPPAALLPVPGRRRSASAAGPRRARNSLLGARSSPREARNSPGEAHVSPREAGTRQARTTCHPERPGTRLARPTCRPERPGTRLARPTCHPERPGLASRGPRVTRRGRDSPREARVSPREAVTRLARPACHPERPGTRLARPTRHPERPGTRLARPTCQPDSLNEAGNSPGEARIPLRRQVPCRHRKRSAPPRAGMRTGSVGGQAGTGEAAPARPCDRNGQRIGHDPKIFKDAFRRRVMGRKELLSHACSCHLILAVS
jgi:hypothetical protein